MKADRPDHFAGQDRNHCADKQGAEKQSQETQPLRGLVRARQVLKPDRSPFVFQCCDDQTGNQGRHGNQFTNEPFCERGQGGQKKHRHQGPVEPVPGAHDVLQTPGAEPNLIEYMSSQQTIGFPVFLASLLNHLARERRRRWLLVPADREQIIPHPLFVE